jgi:hypothetical protein
MANMKLISSVTVGSGGAANINFSSIPATFKDLKLVVSARTSQAVPQDNGLISFNGSSSSFAYKRLYGDGAGGVGAGSASTNSINIVYSAATATANAFNNSEVYISNYTSSDYKPWSVDSVQENQTTEAYAFLIAGIWQSTAVINQITIAPASGANFVQNSTAYLYGISNS